MYTFLTLEASQDRSFKRVKVIWFRFSKSGAKLALTDLDSSSPYTNLTSVQLKLIFLCNLFLCIIEWLLGSQNYRRAAVEMNDTQILLLK